MTLFGLGAMVPGPVLRGDGNVLVWGRVKTLLRQRAAGRVKTLLRQRATGRFKTPLRLRAAGISALRSPHSALA